MALGNFVRLLTSGDTRTVKIKKNIGYSIIFKLGAIFLSFFIIRVTYQCLDEQRFGAWVTILSVLSWVNLFDIGIGNGLRNRLSEAFALNDVRLSKTYVSTSYAIIGIIVLTLVIVMLVLIRILNFSTIFNVDNIIGNEIKDVIKWVVVFYLITFWLSLINSISLASQDSAIPDVIRFITNILILITLYLIYVSDIQSLFEVGFYYSLFTLIPVLLANVLLFAKKYKHIKPQVSSISIRHSGSIVSLGTGFFIIQVTFIIIFTSDNMIITQLLGPEFTASYQIVHKLFYLFSIAFGIILTPLWSGFTDAYIKEDYYWMIRVVKKLIMLLIPITISVVIMVIFSKQIIQIWIGEEIEVPLMLIAFMAIFAVQSCWNNIFAFFLNGIGKIKLQIVSSLIGGIINIPLSIYFVRVFNLGTSGVILATIVSLFFGSIALPLQTYMILKSKAGKST